MYYSHDLPPLNNEFLAPQLDGAPKQVLKACLEHKWACEVHTAQRRGWLPPDDELAALPAFAAARADDADFIRSLEQDAALREEQAAKAAQEAARVEKERARRAEHLCLICLSLCDHAQ